MAQIKLRTVATIGVSLLALSLVPPAFAADPAPQPNKPLNEVKMTGATLSEALDYLRDISGANIDVQWKALELVGVSKDTPITLRLRNVPLRVALKKTLDSAAPGLLDFYVADNIITITSKQEADAQMVTQTIPVHDLLLDIPDFKGPRLDLNSATQNNNSSSGTGSATGGRSSSSSSTSIFDSTDSKSDVKQKTRDEKAQELVDIIQSTIRPEVWDVNGGKAHIKFFNGNLIITAPMAVQRLIAG